MQTVAEELLDFRTNRQRKLLSFPSVAQIMFNIQQIIDTIHGMSDCNSQVIMVSVWNQKCHLKEADFPSMSPKILQQKTTIHLTSSFRTDILNNPWPAKIQNLKMPTLPFAFPINDNPIPPELNTHRVRSRRRF
mmetsp:Transcript_43272/g.50667  ORF Transcript_43272/g.50667 Transcript_43272/m.50667 type:complete len:134 (-) Transcript_43272:83-484(-)